MFCGLMSISSRSWPTVDENRTSLHCQFKFKRGNQCKTLNIVDGYESSLFHSKFMNLHFKYFRARARGVYLSENHY